MKYFLIFLLTLGLTGCARRTFIVYEQTSLGNLYPKYIVREIRGKKIELLRDTDSDDPCGKLPELECDGRFLR